MKKKLKSKIKFVKKANLYCKSSWDEDEKQTIEWFFDIDCTKSIKK